MEHWKAADPAMCDRSKRETGDPFTHTRRSVDSQVFTLAQQGFYMLLTMLAPLLLTILVVGLAVSVLQAATQINETTLSFVPKVVAAVAVLAIAGPWMLTSLADYIRGTLMSIPSVVQ
jgi:flagellar biosynthetic protein FliQ